jgi:WD40 repeat protein
VAFTSDGKRAVTGGLAVKLWNVADGKLVRMLSREEHWGSFPNREIAVSPDGRLALSGGEDAKVRLWDLATGQLMRTFMGKGVPTPVHAVAFSPDGKWALSGGEGQVLKLWNVSSGREIRTLVPGPERPNFWEWFADRLPLQPWPP